MSKSLVYWVHLGSSDQMNKEVVKGTAYAWMNFTLGYNTTLLQTRQETPAITVSGMRMQLEKLININAT